MILTALAVVVLNWGITQPLGLKADFSAAGLQSNFARIDLLKSAKKRGEDAHITLLGSSMIGRLLPRFFPPENGLILNLGMDGGGGNSALELFMNSGLHTEIAVIELNGLGYEVTSQGAEVIEYESSLEADLRATAPVLSYQYRPSDMLYTRLKSWNDNRSPGRLIESPLEDKDVPLTKEQKAYFKELGITIQSRANRVVFIEIPSRAVPNRYIGEYLKNLGHQIIKMDDFDTDQLRLTDQIHLNLPSAKLVSRSLVKQFKDE